jgi:transglutaminase-like putative cysteine protease
MARRAASAVVSVERFFELSLLGLVASGYLAVVSSGHLDLPTAALTAAGLLLRALLVTGVVSFQVSRPVLTALAIGYLGFYPLDCAFLSKEVLPATVHLVFLLAVTKIVTARTGRDHILVAVIGFLELLAASVLSTNLNFFAALACFLLFGVATFASAEIHLSTRRSRQVARNGLRNFHWRLAALSLSMAVGILALTGGLFFLLPRTAQAAFQRLVPQRYRISGFTNEMTLGQIGQIQQRTTAVMRVRFAGAEFSGYFKWRGVRLSQFDGRRWFNAPEAGETLTVAEGLLRLADNRQLWRPGRRINYEVQVNAVASDALFFAGTPEFMRINSPTVVRMAGDSYRLGSGVSEKLRYGAYSFVDEGASPVGDPASSITPAMRTLYLQLPPLDPRIATLARRLTAGQNSDEGRARTIQEHLRRNYRYATRLPARQHSDPLADFLFERRQGHCEYFASAMAVLLRSVGIPARIANGFQSGVFNPVSGWYIIRASDAHSWVEAWLAGRGWTTFDPTPPAPHAASPSLWARLGFYVDAAETFWDEWVLNYDLGRQLMLASRMETSGRSFSMRWLDKLRVRAREWKQVSAAWASQYGATALLVVAGLAALILALPRARTLWNTRQRVREARRGAAKPSDATLLYSRMLGLLKRRGFQKPAWLTPVEFAHSLPASQTALLVEDFTQAYNDLRFGGRREAARRMMALLEQLPTAGR